MKTNYLRHINFALIISVAVLIADAQFSKAETIPANIKRIEFDETPLSVVVDFFRTKSAEINGLGKAIIL